MSRTHLVLAIGSLVVLQLLLGLPGAQSALPHGPLQRPFESRWEPPFQHDLSGFPPILPAFNAIHMALIPKGPHRGKVIVFDNYPDANQPEWKQRWSIVEVPDSGPPVCQNHELSLPAGFGDFFCAGHAWSADGNLFVAGGTSHYPTQKFLHSPNARGRCPCGRTPSQCACHHHRHRSDEEGYYGGKLAYIWDPADGPAGTWVRQDDLAVDRWYPTVLKLGDGSLLVAGGIEESGDDIFNDNDYEVFQTATPTSGSWVSNGSSTIFPGPGGFGPFSLYPRLFHLSTGEQFLAGMTGRSTKGNHAATPGQWIPTDRAQWDYRTYSTAILLPLLPDALGDYVDEIMIVGGFGADVLRSRSPEDGAFYVQPGGVQSLVETCSPGSSNPADWAWVQAPALHHARMMANAVILADGSVFVTGGRMGAGINGLPVLESELFDGTGWAKLPSHASPRTYHSTAVLLPNAKVLTGGGDTLTWAYQVFVPAYLRTGTPRPEITSAPASMGYGAEAAPDYAIEFANLPGGTSVARAVLVSPGSITHHCDVNQRYVELVKVGASATQITVEAPRDRNLVPPGYYMLFLLSSSGVPSHAAWVHVE